MITMTLTALIFILFGDVAFVFGVGTQQTSTPCGVMNPNGHRTVENGSVQIPSFRVIGGSNAQPGEFPFQVLLTINSKQFFGDESRCGGTVISKNCVLTAAHCFFFCDNEDVKKAYSVEAKFGAYNADGWFDYKKKMTSLDFVPHPEYKPCAVAPRNDIGIVRFSEDIPMEMTKNGYKSVGTICMPSSDSFNHAKVCGWGHTKPDSDKEQDILQKADMDYVDRKKCFAPVDNTQLCAVNSNSVTCSGDSGGPLFTVTNGQATQVGIISYGREKCPVGKPTVFTNVKSFDKWIRETCQNM